MQIKELTESIALIVPMLILVEGIVALVAWFSMGSKGGRGARIAAWLGLVTLTLWCGSAIAFVAAQPRATSASARRPRSSRRCW